MPTGVVTRERAVDIGTSGTGRSPRRWADAIVYPARQFSDLRHATVWPGVQQVAQLLAAGIDDPLTIAVWLDSANPDLDAHTAYDWFAAGGEPERVAASARRDARRLSQ